MRPAFSVIFFTTLSGAGQGLFLALYGVEVAIVLQALTLSVSKMFFVLGSLLSILLTGLGLLASFLHLGHPERAWRAAAMWRTSWLSREVIVLPVFMATVACYGLAHYLDWKGTLTIGGISAALCVALFVCTAMIYACIKFLREWSSPLTVINYFLLGTASGFTLAAAFSVFTAIELSRGLVSLAALLTLAALVARVTSLVRNARLKPKSSLQTALGIKHPRIVQKSQGFMGGSYNTREFFHGKSVSFFRTVKWGFLLLAFALPLVMLMVGASFDRPPASLLITAFVTQYVGLLAERWFFFAQANHPQNLYYQAISESPV